MMIDPKFSKPEASDAAFAEILHKLSTPNISSSITGMVLTPILFRVL